jgi:serine phosphatase RsbU (regulator of sigma subunit)
MPRKPGRVVPRRDPSSGAASRLSDLLSPPLRARALMRRFAAGDSIVVEGEPGSSMFILLEGVCQVSVHGEVLSQVIAGEVFGEIAGLERGTRTATVRAAAESTVLEITATDLQSELRRSPALLDRFLRAMAGRVRAISRRETFTRDEHRQLRRVQESLQPSVDRVANEAVSVEVRWQPLSFASGDYYDVLELAPRHLLFALGDVLGHGAPTSPIVGMIRSQLRESATAKRRPHDLLAHLHKHLLQHGHPEMFMTLTLLVLDLDSQMAEFSVAGPPCPLFYSNGQCGPLTTQAGWTLGYPFDDIQFSSETVQVTHGDAFLFYTDGLSDAPCGPDPQQDMLGAERLAAMFSDLCARDTRGIADELFKRVDHYRSGCPFEDDATALVVKVR